MKAKRKALIDLDGLLIQFKHTYHDACWECGLIISKALGLNNPRPMNVLQLQSEIDLEMMNGQFGVHDHRFPTSWVRTYSRLAHELGEPIDPIVADRLYATASKFKDGPWPLMPYAVETLEWLKAHGYVRYLVTAGPSGLQNKKVDACGLRQHLEYVVPTPMDKQPTMARIVGRHPGRAFMLGDSRGGDMIPAIKLGIPAIWLRNTNTWQVAEAELDPGTHYTIQGLEQLPALLECLYQD